MHFDEKDKSLKRHARKKKDFSHYTVYSSQYFLTFTEHQDGKK